MTRMRLVAWVVGGAGLSAGCLLDFDPYDPRLTDVPATAAGAGGAGGAGGSSVTAGGAGGADGCSAETVATVASVVECVHEDLMDPEACGTASTFTIDDRDENAGNARATGYLRFDVPGHCGAVVGLVLEATVSDLAEAQGGNS